MKFFKIFGNKHYENNSYNIPSVTRIREQPFHIFKDTSGTDYLVKEIDLINPCEVYFKIEVLREIAYGEGFLEKPEIKKKLMELFGTKRIIEDLDEVKEEIFFNWEDIENEVLKDYMDELLKNYDEAEFRAQLEIFTGEFIRKIRPNCSPKYRLFKLEHEPNEKMSEQTQEIAKKVWIGSKFKANYTDSAFAYKPADESKNQPATLFGERIGKDFCVETTDDKSIPIDNLGDCAVLRYIVGRLDCHNSNWGFSKPQKIDDSYSVGLVDFGRCFALLDSKERLARLQQGFYDEEMAMILENPNNIIKIVFEPEYSNSSRSMSDRRSSRIFSSRSRSTSRSSSMSVPVKCLPLPESVYSSERIRHDILTIVDHLAKLNRDETIDMLKIHFKNFPYHINILADDILQTIQALKMVMDEYRNRLNVKLDYKSGR